MSLHTLRKVIDLVPDAAEFIKQASTAQEFPTNSKESTLASALEINFLLKVANENVDYNTFVRVSRAVDLYGLKDKVETLSSQMVKAAQVNPSAMQKDISSEVRVAESYFASSLSTGFDLEKAASAASDLFDSYSEYVTDETVKKYAGACGLDKEAALVGLVNRFQRTGNKEFIKVAKIIDASDVSKFDMADMRTIASVVTRLDKQEGLAGFNFYNEAFITKQAATKAYEVKVCGKNIPVETLMAHKDRIGQALGKDVAAELGDFSDVQTVKAVIESLPLDLQKLLCSTCGVR